MKTLNKVFKSSSSIFCANPKKMTYERMIIEIVPCVPDCPFLAASVIDNNSIIQSTGQELGPIYDLSSSDNTDINTGKEFNHEWETGDSF